MLETSCNSTCIVQLFVPLITGYTYRLLLSFLLLFVSFGQRINGQPHDNGDKDLAGERVDRLEGGVHGGRRGQQGHVQGVRNGRRDENGAHREERGMPSDLQEEGVQEPIATGVCVCVGCKK